MNHQQWLDHAEKQAAALEGLPVRFHNWNCALRCGYYLSGRLAIELLSVGTGEPAAIATVDIPEYNGILGEDEVFIKDYGENEGILAALEGAGILQATGEVREVGHARVQVARLLIGEGLGVRQMDSRSLLARVASGQSDRADADQLRRWLYPAEQGKTVDAHHWLISMASQGKLREYLSPDLRLGLAERLTEDLGRGADLPAEAS